MICKVHVSAALDLDPTLLYVSIQVLFNFITGSTVAANNLLAF